MLANFHRLGALVLLGCSLGACMATVPMASPDEDLRAKSLRPRAGLALLYLYRNEGLGGAIKMTLSVDGRLVGETGPKTYYVLEIVPGVHQIVSMAEQQTAVQVAAQPGGTYFVWQEVKMGVWSADSKIQQVDEVTGRAGVADCSLAR